MAETILVESTGAECDVQIDTWLKDILPYTPGVVREVAEREFLLACREFYHETQCWRVTVGPKDMTAGKFRYYMSPYDAYADIIAVNAVEYLGYPMTPLARRPGAQRDTAERPEAFYLEAEDIIALWPTPNTTVEDALTFYVSLIPKISVRTLPRVSRTLHYEALRDGVLGRLLGQPAKPYSNPTLAQYHFSRFRNHIGTFRAEAFTGNTQPGSSWSYPYFGK